MTVPLTHKEMRSLLKKAREKFPDPVDIEKKRVWFTTEHQKRRTKK
jgi:hypothetical protein